MSPGSTLTPLDVSVRYAPHGTQKGSDAGEHPWSVEIASGGIARRWFRPGGRADNAAGTGTPVGRFIPDPNPRPDRTPLGSRGALGRGGRAEEGLV